MLKFIDEMPELIREKLAGISLHYDDEESEKIGSPIYRLYLYWHEGFNLDDEEYPCHKGEIVGPGECWIIVESMVPGVPPWEKSKQAN